MGFGVKYDVAFVHIPKNAGVSIRSMLGPWDWGGIHLTARELRSVGPGRWDRYFKISVVRNPWDRMVSLYSYCKTRNKYRYEERAQEVDFETWIVDIYENQLFKDDEEHAKNWAQFYAHDQLQWIVDENKKIIVDYVMRFENLDYDWKVIQKRFNAGPLPKKNTTRHDNYQDYYSDNTRELVRKAFEEDIEYFSYQFSN